MVGRAVVWIVPLVGFGAARGFALVSGLAGALLGSLGRFFATLVGNVVAILVRPGVRLRIVVALAA